jgi:PPM family protein phosphatase
VTASLIPLRRRACAAGVSHVGKVRGNNEDRILLAPELGLYAVFDGLGGHAAGEVAAQLASDTLRAFVGSQQPSAKLAPRELLGVALNAASAAVFDRARQQLECAGMGTTVVVCLLVEPDRVLIAHVGDSHAYQLRGDRLQMLTRDHTVAEQWIQDGWLPEVAKKYYMGRELTRSLGREATVQADVIEVDIEANDRLLLCSDGLFGFVSNEAIQHALDDQGSPDQQVHALLELALDAGGSDNISAIVIAEDTHKRWSI